MPKLKDLPFLSLTENEQRAAVLALATNIDHCGHNREDFGTAMLPDESADRVRLALHSLLSELPEGAPLYRASASAHSKLIRSQAIYAQNRQPAPDGKPDRGEDPVCLQVQIADAELVARALLRHADWIDAVNEVTPGPNARTISERLRYYGQDILDALAERDQGQ